MLCMIRCVMDIRHLPMSTQNLRRPRDLTIQPPAWHQPAEKDTNAPLVRLKTGRSIVCRTP